MEAKKNHYNVDEQLDKKLDMGDRIKDNIIYQVNLSTENLNDCNNKIKSLKNEFLMEEESNLENILISEFPIVK